MPRSPAADLELITKTDEGGVLLGRRFQMQLSLTFLPCPPLDLLLAARQGGCCAIRWSGRVCICVRKRGRKEQQQPSLLPVSV